MCDWKTCAICDDNLFSSVVRLVDVIIQVGYKMMCRATVEDPIIWIVWRRSHVRERLPWHRQWGVLARSGVDVATGLLHLREHVCTVPKHTTYLALAVIPTGGVFLAWWILLPSVVDAIVVPVVPAIPRAVVPVVVFVVWWTCVSHVSRDWKRVVRSNVL